MEEKPVHSGNAAKQYKSPLRLSITWHFQARMDFKASPIEGAAVFQ
jgi:hypothetical protein